MTPKEIFTALINRINNNPTNSKKFYFTFEETTGIDKSITLEIKFGISENNYILFKEFMSNGGDKTISEERIYSTAINKIFENIHNRIEDNTFWDWQI